MGFRAKREDNRFGSGRSGMPNLHGVAKGAIVSHRIELATGLGKWSNSTGRGQLEVGEREANNDRLEACC